MSKSPKCVKYYVLIITAFLLLVFIIPGNSQGANLATGIYTISDDGLRKLDFYGTQLDTSANFEFGDIKVNSIPLVSGFKSFIINIPDINVMNSKSYWLGPGDWTNNIDESHLIELENEINPHNGMIHIDFPEFNKKGGGIVGLTIHLPTEVRMYWVRIEGKLPGKSQESQDYSITGDYIDIIDPEQRHVELASVLADDKRFKGSAKIDGKDHIFRFTITFSEYDSVSGQFIGMIEWVNDATNKIEGNLNGTILYFKETETIKKGSAIPGTEYSMSLVKNRKMMGRWEFQDVEGNAYDGDVQITLMKVVTQEEYAEKTKSAETVVRETGGRISPLVNGKPIMTHGSSYTLWDDYLFLGIHPESKISLGSVVLTRAYYQIDWHPLDNPNPPQNELHIRKGKPSEIKWKNPRDKKVHTITLKAYFGKLENPHFDSNGNTVSDTVEYAEPAVHRFRVECMSR